MRALLVLASLVGVSHGFTTIAAPHLTRLRSENRATVVAAVKKKAAKASRTMLDVSKGEIGDVYRRGSFGIGENESKVLWVVLLSALLFSGSLDDETAQKIGEAQRGFYPKPPGMEQVEALKARP